MLMLLAYIACAAEMGVMANNIYANQDSIDKSSVSFAGKAHQWVINSPVLFANLDDSMLGKLGELRTAPRLTFLPDRYGGWRRCPVRAPRTAPQHLSISTLPVPCHCCSKTAGWNVPLDATRYAAVDQEVGAWQQLKEFLGENGGDPGHWNFSPEWWGSQVDDWGDNNGTVVFQADSEVNGDVVVTSHTASALDADSKEGREEWRVLRFQAVTLQSVVRVTMLPGGERVLQQPQCLASEYLKSMAAVAAGLMGLLPQSDKAMRVLCIGVGGGALPVFLAHHFPQMEVEGVEVDPVVMQAATEAMGLVQPMLPNLRFRTEDAFDCLQRHVSAGSAPYDLVLVDAFDGDEEIPRALSGEAFGKLLASALSPERGAVIMNVHNEEEVASLAENYYGAMRTAGRAGGTAEPQCFTLECTWGPNIMSSTVFVAANAMKMPADTSSARRMLGDAAADVAARAGFTFRARRRASHKYQRILLGENGTTST
eukprot:gnl/TRDRNA2_/TRDRNA2_64646_c0_seq1.p1 gnl/TRDRNA2_/TRDRNA2_64646_c0~~gnl/TRDRNA2_/TRDRNA2_64646_c0_seq1.p1  ORF type:complete len:483 (-),score=62.98 gnl/TRDRNA2_/TRDRNA2_64646_c0_seq1:62-1510(-)